MSTHSFLRSLTPGSRHRRKLQHDDATRASAQSAGSRLRPDTAPSSLRHDLSGFPLRSHNPDTYDDLPSDVDAAADSPTIFDRRPSASRAAPSRPSSTTNQHRPLVAFFNDTDHDANAVNTPDHARSSTNTYPSRSQSHASYDTDATSVLTLPALQTKVASHEWSQLEPVREDDPASFDLVNPAQGTGPEAYSLEARSEQIFSANHLRQIFADPKSLLKFTSFLGTHRPNSVPLLIYYLDALKALSAIKYANAVAAALEPLDKLDFTSSQPDPTANAGLEFKARQAFDALANDDLAAFVTHTWVSVVSTSIRRRITGTMPPHLRDASEGLAEVFCLTDPSREDNPIVFASEEFHRTTQYGVNFVIGRNCRFLQGPRTNRESTRRLRDAMAAGKDICETFVNYRRDGSPFMNLLMTAPLRDSRGNLRYFIGAQVDVSGLAKECTELEAAQRMLTEQSEGAVQTSSTKGELEELSEMFNQVELDIIRKSGGALHHEKVDDDDASGAWPGRPRLLLKDPSAEDTLNQYTEHTQPRPRNTLHGRLVGVYQNYLLVRPYPSLRILFASPSLRVPGILQSPFMNRIGSSERVRDELLSALADGRGVTAKIRWVSRHEDEGRNRWIHCTPLLGSNGQVGVWMVVIVDDDGSRPVRRFREAPPVAEVIGRTQAGQVNGHVNGQVNVSKPGSSDGANDPSGAGARTATMGSQSDDNDYRF